jgi:hypothetical protein
VLALEDEPSSLSGDSESGVPDVSSIEPGIEPGIELPIAPVVLEAAREAVSAPARTSEGGGSVWSAGLCGSGGTVGR